jgi:hypothetical protein
VSNGRRLEPEYRPWWGRLPIIALIALLFSLGAYRIAVADNDMDGFAMVTVAILLVGVWLTVELHDKFYGEHRQQMQYIHNAVEAIKEDIVGEESE